MAKGYIKLYREIEDNAIWENDEPFDKRSAWVDLILMANHATKEIVIGNQSIVIRRGEKLTSVRKLAYRWHWSKDKALAYLRLLEELGMIYRTKTLNATLISVVNYEKYQGGQDTNKDTIKDTIKDTTSSSVKDTIKDTYSPQTRMSKNEYKNDKRMREE